MFLYIHLQILHHQQDSSSNLNSPCTFFYSLLSILILYFINTSRLYHSTILFLFHASIKPTHWEITPHFKHFSPNPRLTNSSQNIPTTNYSRNTKRQSPEILKKSLSSKLYKASSSTNHHHKSLKYAT